MTAGMHGACWGAGTLMARTEAFRLLGGFDGRFRRCAELDLAVRAALEGRISSASMRHSSSSTSARQQKGPTPIFDTAFY